MGESPGTGAAKEGAVIQAGARYRPSQGLGIGLSGIQSEGMKEGQKMTTIHHPAADRLDEAVRAAWDIDRLQDLITARVDLTLTIPGDAMLYGGVAAAKELREKQPWKERREELRGAAAAVTAATVDGVLPPPGTVADASDEGPLYTVFRRHPDTGQLCLSANQLRTCLAEAARANYSVSDSMLLQKGIRFNVWFEPTLLPLWRGGEPVAPVMEPDGIAYMPRPINKPPFPRSIIAQPEFVNGPLLVRLTAFFMETKTASGKAISDPGVFTHLLTYAGGVVGLGSHRGLDANGRFIATLGTWTPLKASGPPALARFRDKSRAV